MKIAGRDYIFAAVIVGLFVVLFVGKDNAKSVSVPNDDKHKHFFEAVAKGEERAEVEKRCTSCHSKLSQSHPPKEQCLICHKLSQGNK